MSRAIIKKLSAPPICESEILRYAGCREADEAVLSLMREALLEIEDKLCYRVCYVQSSLSLEGSSCRFDSFSAESSYLAKNLSGADSALIFGATVGVDIDRAIARYGHVSPSRAVMLQAIGAERIEALCKAFCREYEAEHRVKLKPRFSPGYKDLSLGVQRDIFRVLDCSRSIGLCLNESLLMSPSKSVSAIAGIKEKK